MYRPTLLAASIIAFASNVVANGLGEAKQYLDQAAPLHCELLTMKFQAESLRTDPAAREALITKLYKRAADVERDLSTTMQRYEAARAALTDEELQKLRGHSAALLENCARKASETYGVQVPIPISPEKPRPKVVPYTPGMGQKSLRPEAQPAPIQGQPVGQ